jgi:hypothetical protein
MFADGANFIIKPKAPPPGQFLIKSLGVPHPNPGVGHTIDRHITKIDILHFTVLASRPKYFKHALNRTLASHPSRVHVKFIFAIRS